MTRMERRIVLVRAVNVGGTAKLPMAQWRSLAEGLGACDVSTYIASGNMVCTIDADPRSFDESLEKAVEERFGFFRHVISRSLAEVEAALAGHPFEVLDPKRSFISFLTGAPTAEGIAAARSLDTGGDRWEVVGREMHLRFADGAGHPQMKERQIMRVLDVVGTARNLATVGKLIDLARRE